MLHKVLNVTGNVVSMPKHFIIDERLSLSAKGLLAVLFSLDEPVELKELAEMFGEKKETVESSMKELIEAGYLGEREVMKDDYVTIQDWMVSELDLKGSELIIYAIIFESSKDGSSVFTGSAQYLADWTNTTKQSVFKVLKSLTDRKLIIRHEETRNGVMFVSYSYNPDALVTVEDIK